MLRKQICLLRPSELTPLRLTSLELCGNFIGAEGANSLAQALRVNITLSSLNLTGNFIGTEGATLLA